MPALCAAGPTILGGLAAYGLLASCALVAVVLLPAAWSARKPADAAVSD
jgi:hypothetical protein